MSHWCQFFSPTDQKKFRFLSPQNFWTASICWKCTYGSPFPKGVMNSLQCTKWRIFVYDYVHICIWKMCVSSIWHQIVYLNGLNLYGSTLYLRFCDRRSIEIQCTGTQRLSVTLWMVSRLSRDYRHHFAQQSPLHDVSMLKDLGRIKHHTTKPKLWASLWVRATHKPMKSQSLFLERRGHDLKWHGDVMVWRIEMRATPNFGEPVTDWCNKEDITSHWTKLANRRAGQTLYPFDAGDSRLWFELLTTPRNGRSGFVEGVTDSTGPLNCRLYVVCTWFGTMFPHLTPRKWTLSS